MEEGNDGAGGLGIGAQEERKAGVLEEITDVVIFEGADSAVGGFTNAAEAAVCMEEDEEPVSTLIDVDGVDGELSDAH
jgi:hypothetical protein